jgi:hypothetical protein
MTIRLKWRHREAFLKSYKNRYKNVRFLVTESCTLWQALKERMPNAKISVGISNIYINKQPYPLNQELKTFMRNEDRYIMHGKGISPKLGTFIIDTISKSSVCAPI